MTCPPKHTKKGIHIISHYFWRKPLLPVLRMLQNKILKARIAKYSISYEKNTYRLPFLENASTNVPQIFSLGLNGNSSNPKKTHSFNLECWLLECVLLESN